MTKFVISFDVETTSLPNWKLPSDDESQPHIVQVGAIKFNSETGEQVDLIDVVVKPDGWVIPDEVIAIHGITNEYALERGIQEKDAVSMLLEFIGDDDCFAFNKNFDKRIIRIGTKRFLSEDAQNKWKEKENFFCSMQMANKAIGGKNTLEKAYTHFVGESFQDAHDAVVDSRASAMVYFSIKSPDVYDLICKQTLKETIFYKN